MNLDFRLPGAEPEAKPNFQPASENELYDVIILGAGPAGTTAAVYCARKGLKVMILTENIGGQVLTTAEIENYSGFQYVTGPELAAKFKTQMSRFPLALLQPARTRAFAPRGDEFVVTASTGGNYHGRAVIVASGAQPRKLNVPGENELSGRGVTYCATCDAPLYAGKSVAVVGGGNSALTSLLDLAGIARQAFAVVRGPDFQGDAVLVEQVRKATSIRVITNSEVQAIFGQDRVNAIEIRNRTSGATELLAVDGVFIEIGWIPDSEFARGVLELNSSGEIVIGDRNETSVPGAFAAGDVTDVREKQIVIAAGEGAKAALAATEWLRSRPRSS